MKAKDAEDFLKENEDFVRKNEGLVSVLKKTEGLIHLTVITFTCLAVGVLFYRGFVSSKEMPKDLPALILLVLLVSAAVMYFVNNCYQKYKIEILRFMRNLESHHERNLNEVNREKIESVEKLRYEKDLLINQIEEANAEVVRKLEYFLRRMIDGHYSGKPSDKPSESGLSFSVVAVVDEFMSKGGKNLPENCIDLICSSGNSVNHQDTLMNWALSRLEKLNLDLAEARRKKVTENVAIDPELMTQRERAEEVFNKLQQRISRSRSGKDKVTNITAGVAKIHAAASN